MKTMKVVPPKYATNTIKTSASNQTTKTYKNVNKSLNV